MVAFVDDDEPVVLHEILDRIAIQLRLHGCDVHPASEVAFARSKSADGGLRFRAAPLLRLF